MQLARTPAGGTGASRISFEEQVKVLKNFFGAFKPKSAYKDACMLALDCCGDGLGVAGADWVQICSELKREYGESPTEMWAAKQPGSSYAGSAYAGSAYAGSRFSSFSSIGSGMAGGDGVQFSFVEEPLRSTGLVLSKISSRDTQSVAKMAAGALQIGAIKTGWLEKEGKKGLGNVGKKFAMRWFVLAPNPDAGQMSDAHCFLAYYTHERDSSPRGVVPLRAGKFEITEPKTKRKGDLHCFRLNVGDYHNSSKWILGAKTAEERHDWIQAINAVEEEHGQGRKERALLQDKQELQEALETLRTDAELQRMEAAVARIRNLPLVRAFEAWAHLVFVAAVAAEKHSEIMAAIGGLPGADGGGGSVQEADMQMRLLQAKLRESELVLDKEREQCEATQVELQELRDATAAGVADAVVQALVSNEHVDKVANMALEQSESREDLEAMIDEQDALLLKQRQKLTALNEQLRHERKLREQLTQASGVPERQLAIVECAVEEKQTAMVRSRPGVCAHCPVAIPI